MVCFVCHVLGCANWPGTRVRACVVGDGVFDSHHFMASYVTENAKRVPEI